MKDLKVANESGLRCLKSVKNIVRALRYVEDYFIEYSHAKYASKSFKAQDYKTLSGNGRYFLINPKFSHEFKDYTDLRSGDVILSRGNAYSSAAIARIGDDDSQFSHLSLVYKDENNDLHTSEAHIEVGNVVAPIKVNIDQANARSVVFRHADEKLSHLAGEYMYKKVKDYSDTYDKNIRYDFAMIYQDDSEIFCSEVVYHGYREAAKNYLGKPMDLPLYKTHFKAGLIGFLQKLGIPVDEKNIDKFDTFGPGEIQFDPRFDIVAEWRNPSKLKDSRFKDAILTKIFTWMEKDEYSFRPHFGNTASHSAAWLLRRSKWARALIKKVSGNDLKDKFPLNMGVKQMNLFVTLDKVGEVMYEELERHQKLSSSPLSFKELYIILEEFKTKDQDVYKKYKAAKRERLRNNSRARSFSRARGKVIRPKFHLSFRK